MTDPQVTSTPAERSVWAAGLVVAVGAGVATAHGLYEVALAAGVPVPIAGLYPLITDGLALVAYAATARLRTGGRSYAWTIVVLAAGLSGLAQAAYLAGGVASGSTMLRFGIGAWPAIAAAIVAHLLYLLSGHATANAVAIDTSASTDVHGPTARPVQPARTAVEVATESTPERPTAASNIGQAAVQPDRAGVQPRTDVEPVERSLLDTLDAGHRLDGDVDDPASGDDGVQPARERARAAALRYAHRHGRLPTVSTLMTLAEVSRGTAGTALQEVREQPVQLHLITTNDELSSTS